MFITYPKNSPELAEYQYILDGSKTLENIQGKVVIPVPRGVNPLNFSGESSWNPVEELRKVLDYSNIKSNLYFQNSGGYRYLLPSSGEVTLTIDSTNSSSTLVSGFSACAFFGKVSPTGFSSPVGGSVNFQSPDPTVAFYYQEDHGTGYGSWLPMLKSAGHSDDFSLVTKRIPLSFNPQMTGLQVRLQVGPQTGVNLLAFGIMYDTY